MGGAHRIPAAITALSGIAWLAAGVALGLWTLALALVPGSLLLAGGVRMLGAPDLRSPQLAALGGALGLPLAIGVGVVAGSPWGVAAAAVALAGFVASGWSALAADPGADDVPAPPLSPAYAARVALDEAMLSSMLLLAPSPAADDLRGAAREVERAREVLQARGWLEKPLDFHVAPPPLEELTLEPAHQGRLAYERMSFESGFTPDPALPGAQRWHGFEENRTAWAWLLRHPGEPRPWLVGVHGFGMGVPRADLSAFRARWLHHRLGLNVALYVLPVHGRRSPGGLPGAEFMSPTEPLNMVHAETQAIWDLRRLIGWIRGQGAPAVAVHGISLGGYTTALLAGVEPLDCAIAGIPPSDFVHTSLHLAGPLERASFDRAGFDWEAQRDVQRVVSPLAMAPQLEQRRRFVYAATGDCFVPPVQVRNLWRHWERPRIAWTRGGHVSALMSREVRTLVEEALRATLPGLG